ADLAGDSRSFGSDQGLEESLGIGVDGGAGAQLDEQRGSRARTTGELTEESGPGGPVTNASGRSSGPSNGSSKSPSAGPDLDLGHRAGKDPFGSTAPAPAAPPDGAGGTAVTDSTADRDSRTSSTSRVVANDAAMADEVPAPTTSTSPSISSHGSEPPTNASAVTVDSGAEQEDTVAGGPGSLPSGSTSLPEPAAPPSQVTLPPSVTPPPVVTPPKSPPSTNGPPVTTPARPPVAATPPTTRKPVPADTRPSPGGGRNRARGRSGDTSSNSSNGRAGGRKR
ncbi:MAG: hypothetical protein OEW83_23150, partial [Acidimicrobiia bacterium]|nr:hypothetical protein [Acidimicrobiia bacterium]